MQTAMSIVTKLLHKIDKGSGNEIQKILNGCLCVCVVVAQEQKFWTYINPTQTGGRGGGG